MSRFRISGPAFLLSVPCNGKPAGMPVSHYGEGDENQGKPFRVGLFLDVRRRDGDRAHQSVVCVVQAELAIVQQ